MLASSARVWAVDLFCGVGGLSYGLQEAGVAVVAGVDIEPSCRFPFETNIESPFIEADIRDVKATQLFRLWPDEGIRMLAGCAPCQPFSPYRRGADTSAEEQWPLLDEFGRLIRETNPEIVTMENVPRVGSSPVFARFVDNLRECGYWVDWRSCYGPDYGLPQHRRRLVLIASRLGAISVPTRIGDGRANPVTVRDTISHLPRLDSGGRDPRDSLHRTRSLSPLNLARIRASKPGGTWHDWPDELLAPCHRKPSGASFKNVYARMKWDEPSPTITTLAHSFGAGRFGHPDQDRPLSLREAAMLQGFPSKYQFVDAKSPIRFSHLGRLIGNAVPPPLGLMVGNAVHEHISEITEAGA